MLAKSVVQRIQRFGQSSVFKRTVLQVTPGQTPSSQLSRAFQTCVLHCLTLRLFTFFSFAVGGMLAVANNGGDNGGEHCEWRALVDSQ
jgi:hypothetical protein